MSKAVGEQPATRAFRARQGTGHAFALTAIETDGSVLRIGLLVVLADNHWAAQSAARSLVV